MKQNIKFNIFNKDLKISLQHQKINTNSIYLTYGDIVLFGSFVINKSNPNNTRGGSNLTVFYKDTPYSQSKTFNKKSFAKTDKEIRISRQIDRSIRPFLSIISNGEITITIMLLQNTSNDSPLSAILWTSSILCYFSGMDKLLKNMYANEISHHNQADMLIAMNDDGIVMLEGYFNNIDQDALLAYVENIQNEQKIFSEIFAKIQPINLFNNIDINPNGNLVNYKTRIDKRKWLEIRPINIELKPLQKISAIFQRGATSVLTVMQIGHYEYNDFSLKYNFHPFSVGESGETFGNSRREKGHSFLAQNSFKYKNYRQLSYDCVGEVLSCNGSSSMATVCGTSLCLNIAYGAELISGITCGIINNQVMVDLTSEEDNISHCDIKIVSSKDKKIYSIFMDTKTIISIDQLKKLINTGLKSNIQIIKIMEQSTKNLDNRCMIQIKREKIQNLLAKNNIETLEAKFSIKIQVFECGLIILKSSNKKHFEVVKKILDSYNSLLHDKQITCVVYNKKILEDKKIVINLGAFNYITDSFKYDIGDIITAIIDNQNNTSSRIILNKIKKILTI